MLGELLAQELPVDGVRVVEIVMALLLVREVARILVVRVLGDDDDLLVVQPFLDCTYDSSLS